MDQLGNGSNRHATAVNAPGTGGRHWRRRIFLLLPLLWLAFTCLPVMAQEWTYRVRPGDTLWDLAGEYLVPGIPWQRLQFHNAVDDPQRLIPGSSLRFPLAWLVIRPARATLVSVHGDAIVERPGGTGPMPAMVGMELDMGTLLRTAADANLTLEFADGSRLQMLADSELHLDRLSLYGRGGMVDTHLRLQRGRIQNRVHRQHDGGASFIIDTPSATSSVRGTLFRVGVEAGHSRTEVIEGTVDVTRRGVRGARLDAGFGTVVTEGSIQPVALLPAPELSRLPTDDLMPGTVLAWPAVDGALAYRVHLGDQPEFGKLLLALDTPLAQVEIPALPEGRYHLSVSAVDTHGLAGTGATAAFDLVVPPAPPFAISPEHDGVAHAARPEFLWSRSSEAQAYRFQLAGNAGFDNPLQSLGTRDTRHRSEHPLPPGEYWWRVASDAEGREGPYGDAIRFVVRPTPGDIGMEPAEAGTGAASRAVTFRWQSGGEGLRYRFQMSRSPDFSRLPVDVVVDQPQATLPRLGAGTWYLRARTLDADGQEGPFAPTQSVRVPCRLCQAVVGGGALLILLAL